jgi:hypothetical protein
MTGMTYRIEPVRATTWSGVCRIALLSSILVTGVAGPRLAVSLASQDSLFTREAASVDTRLVFGPAPAALNGPWKFHIGDDLDWASPNFDDSSWEAVDLTPRPGAHDGDQGLTNYTEGWSARGHRGYDGFAWYRMRVRVADPVSGPLWLAGPALVDNAYQLYVNGHLIGGIGDFSRAPPGVFGLHPRLFALPRELWVVNGNESSAVIVMRVASLKGVSAATDGGGVHIAPVLGTEAGVRDHYRLQWLEKVEAFAVDAIEPVLFLLLAVLALSMLPFDPKDHFNIWIAAALILLAATWFNQPLFWMGNVESLRGFVLLRLTIIDGLTLGVWVMAWRAAFGLDQVRWIALACAGLTLMFLLVRPLSTPLLLPSLPPALIAIAVGAIKAVRLGFLLLLSIVVALGYRRKASNASWVLLFTILAGSVSIFARELRQLGVPGIWFPFGVGLSLSECANAAFGGILFIYLLQRLWRFVPIRSATGRP